jgi:hypothetical protein
MAARRTIRTSALALVLIVAAACDHATSTASAGSATPTPAGSGSPSKGNTMSGFVKASNAFRDHAVKALGTSEVSSGPNNEKVTMPHTIGGAWAFNAALSSDPNRMLRGWALADGTVITLDQNFGRLLEQAGLWATPRSDLANLAAAVAWALGNGYQRRGGATIQLGPDGGGTVAFELAYQEAGGGGHISPVMPCDVAITVAKDHTATVKVSRRP